MSAAVITRAAMAAAVDEIVAGAQHVSINEERLQSLAQSVQDYFRHRPVSDLDGNAVNPAEAPVVNDRDTLQYFLMRRAQSFVIWRWTGQTQPAVEAFDCQVNGVLYTGERAVNACIMRAVNEGVPLLDPSYLSSMTMADVEHVYRDERGGPPTYQLLDRRLAKFREVGQVLSDRYDGHMANLLEAADGQLFRSDGNGSIQALVREFPQCYGDYPFAKLAVTLMTALYNRRDLDIPTTNEYMRLTRIDDPENLFGPTDYYIPMFLMRWGVFDLSDEFNAHLAERTLIDQDSDIEREFRACTLHVFDRVRELAGVSMAELDIEFWYQGAFRCRPCSPADPDPVPCPHRSGCLAWNQDRRRMDLGWPLVYTPFY
ncbi:putative queuosine salvage protein [Ornithinimicrobium humiphilum]|uniref:Queuosine 5'-phosphate N-glycosylase/hydrolase n=1 Tax=Ornithinimicrobium humiphilum TaxID=125288 RepID=A0A543KQJ1_9MICO|nr:queuosine salvage family protein [Ornithinimicrobium humiphilum]TQM97342.1 putative queuosine salvage protein [Ornithinimicrobium humiphilum]